MAFIVPEETAPVEKIINEETGEVEQVIEHYRQGDHRYKIVHDYREPVVEDDGVRSWTPLAIKRACGGRWEAFKAALQEAGIYEDFVMAQELREDDEAFARGVARARELFGDEAVDAVLDAAELARRGL